jgi:anti-sigma regulatory factor (Ser/Thr protein kinase)
VEYVRVLHAVPTAPNEARESLDRLVDALPPGRLEDLRLAVSELVTNAVVHAGLDEEEAIVMKVRLLPGAVRVEVLDRGGGFPEPPEAPGDDHGYGLKLIDRLADRWGAERAAETRVWAEFALGG